MPDVPVTGLYALAMGIAPIAVCGIIQNAAVRTEHEHSEAIVELADWWMLCTYMLTGVLLGTVLEAGTLAQFATWSLPNVFLLWGIAALAALGIRLVPGVTRDDADSNAAPDPAEALKEVND